MILAHARAILWAQFLSLKNFYGRGNTGMAVMTLIMSLIWYGMLVFGGFTAAMVASDPKQLPMLQRNGDTALFFMFLYWQVVPILLASTGASIDLKRIAVYPVSRGELFFLEVLLRLTTGVDMLIILVGAIIGLITNPAVPRWAPLVFLPWTAMNLLLATGLRDLLGRMLARRRGREIAMIVFVLLAAAPQMLFVTGIPDAVRGWIPDFHFEWWPWHNTARLAVSQTMRWGDLAALLAWTAAAAVFSWRQFQRGFRFDADEARATVEDGAALSWKARWADRFFSLPSLILPDPLGALVEKELRFLSRAPRFRIVFLMGFSFGLLIWLPFTFRSGRESEGFLQSNYLTMVSVYALLLLGEVSFWNTFGFDRGAALNYFVLPVKFSRVLIAKNITAAIFVFLEITIIALVCLVLGMPVRPGKLGEAYAVTAVMTLLLLAVGNLGSIHYPRPVNPSHSWRSASAGRFQAFLMMLYPLVGIPVVLAYLARYAFNSQWAFFGVLGVGALLGAIVYWVALESAKEAADKHKEQIVTTLSAGDGPVAA